MAELRDHGRELGDVRSVARVGVGDERHPPVSGHDEAEADYAQVGTFLLGVASLRDRRAALAEAIQVAKLVMSSTRPDKSTPKVLTISATIRRSTSFSWPRL